jgi:antitoxin HicB
MKHRMEDYRFEIRSLSPEDGSGFLVTFPDLPGCMSDGDTPEEAIQNARGAFDAWVETRNALKLPVPKPGVQASGKLLARLPKHLHTALLERAATEGISANTLLVSFVAEGIGKRARP